MKNPIQSIFNGIVLLLIAGSYLLQWLEKKEELAYVDSSKLINNYTGMLEARKAFEDKSMLWRANIDTLTRAVRMAISTYEKQASSMSEKEQDLSKELIETKKLQLADYQKAINEKARQEDILMTNRVIDEINNYLEVYGKKEGYHLIIAATEYGNVAYAEKGIDVTDEVLAELNRQYRGL